MVSLPSAVQRLARDSAYLNDLYRSRAEKAGIIYVDVWDGFVDEAGKFSSQGPDYQGQILRLRTGDGIHFTKYGARKLALYVEREIERLAALRIPVALPTPVDSSSAKILVGLYMRVGARCAIFSHLSARMPAFERMGWKKQGVT